MAARALLRLSAASGLRWAILGLASAVVSSAVMNRGCSPVTDKACGNQKLYRKSKNETEPPEAPRAQESPGRARSPG